MKITIITLFPDMIKGFLNESIIKRAQDNNGIKVEIVNLRDFGEGNYRQVDDRPYGGGAGMVLMAPPLKKAIESAKTKSSYVLLTSAQGSVFNQSEAKKLSKKSHIIIVCGHYEGVDERITKHVDEEVSLGDFVMTGGEITACAVVDSVVRLIPGVLKKSEATKEESFFEASVSELLKIFPKEKFLITISKSKSKKVLLLEYPQFTRPETFEQIKVPEVLLSGNHAKIRKWRLEQAYIQTKKKRPDLLR